MTELVRKYLPALVFVFGLLLISLTLILVKPVKAPSITARNCTNIGRVCYDLERAETNETRIKGLSGRDNMPADSGMFFIFDVPDNQCMWMKDMKFGNDTIWLDESRKIIKIEENIAPESFPNTYCSETPAKYVIELNVGQIKKNGLRVGQQINL